MIMKSQTAVLNNVLQLRRDYYIAASRDIPIDTQLRLKHAPILDQDKLFPPSLVETNILNMQQLQAKVFLERWCELRGRGPGRGGKRRDERAPNPSNTQEKGGDRQFGYDSVSVFSNEEGVIDPKWRLTMVASSKLFTPIGDDDYSWERQQVAILIAISVGGRLETFWCKWHNKWHNIGASMRVAQWLRRGY